MRTRPRENIDEKNLKKVTNLLARNHHYLSHAKIRKQVRDPNNQFILIKKDEALLGLIIFKDKLDDRDNYV
jgi:hypothetical protein